ncbi:MAG: hypothetical protein Q8M76_07760, partial [Spirochaetaceae bacterium]|nr:hypothetical protein [Spirochaetaceae bacterium]
MRPSAKSMIPAAAAAAALFLILGSCKPAEKPASPQAIDASGRPIVETTGEVKPAQASLGFVDALPELVALECAGADRYRFQISGDDSFAFVLYDKEFDDNALAPIDCDTLLAGFRYFWRVMARKEATWGPWSKPADFSLAPAPSEGAFPEPGTTIRDAAPRLAWPAIPGAAAYDLRSALSEEGLASALPIRAAAVDYAFPETLRNYSTVFWQFRAVTESGAPGGWSAVLSFTLRWNPDIYAIYPPNGRSVPQAKPVLEWSAAPEAIAYVLQIADSSSEFDPLSWVDTKATSHRIEVEIPDKQSLQWRVRAKNAQGLYGAWQGPWTFTVDALA